MQKATYLVQSPAQPKTICIRHRVWANLNISKEGVFRASLQLVLVFHLLHNEPLFPGISFQCSLLQLVPVAQVLPLCC